MTQVSKSRLFHLSVADGKNEYLNWLVCAWGAVNWTVFKCRLAQGMCLRVKGQNGQSTLPVSILNNRHSFRDVLLADKVEMFRVSRSELQSVFQDLEQTHAIPILWELFYKTLIYLLYITLSVYRCSIGSCNRLGYRLGEGQMSL